MDAGRSDRAARPQSQAVARTDDDVVRRRIQPWRNVRRRRHRPRRHVRLAAEWEGIGDRRGLQRLHPVDAGIGSDDRGHRTQQSESRAFHGTGDFTAGEVQLTAAILLASGFLVIFGGKAT
jgi:hypothetical protein